VVLIVTLDRGSGMEHRYSNRTTVNVNVLIYKEGVPVAFGRVVNSSKVGFFIETDFSEVNRFQKLDIEIIPYSKSKNLGRYFFTACVIRKSEAGLGVEIDSTKVETKNVKGKCMYERISPLTFSENHSAETRHWNFF
jgi:hypothetical protein